VLPSLRKILPRRRKATDPSRDVPEGTRGDPEAAPRRDRIGNGWRRFRRATNKYRLLTDVIGGLLIVAIVIGGIAAATGGIWPPVVVVESGSMMHGAPETPYGRIGTIDVGDMVFIRGVDGPDDITTWAEGGKLHYGRPGDVIAYAPDGNFSETPVIHRLVAFIEVERQSNGYRIYRLHWTQGEVIAFGPAGIYFPPLGLDETWGFSPNDGYRPSYSGYVTKGDNPVSNLALDQIAVVDGVRPITTIIEPTWIIGKVYGEVPWMGLAKLALQSRTNPEVPNWDRIGNAFAPLELWSMFFLTLGLIILVPLSLDTWRTWRELKRKEETERRLEEENLRRNAARKAALAKQPANAKRVTTFAAVVTPRSAPRSAPPPRRDPPRT